MAYEEMGLDFGDYGDGMEQFLDWDMFREAAIAGGAGGSAMLLTSWGVRQLAENVEMIANIQQPLLKSAVTSTMALVAGLLGGRMMYEYNREAAMGVVGGVGGMAMASFIDTAIAQFTGREKMGIGLGDVDDESLLSAYNDVDGMEALAALETTGVSTAPGAFSGFADPSVTPEALMGLDGTVVQQETLGESGYAPYLNGL